MKKAIHIESTSNNIAAVLSVAPVSFAPTHDGRDYIVIEDYHEPTLTDPMDKAYPVYDKAEKKFSYLIEKWTITAQQDRLELANLKAELQKTTAEAVALKADLQRSVMELTMLIAGAGGSTSVPQPSTAT